jgi:phosphatidylserine decarboxylase
MKNTSGSVSFFYGTAFGRFILKTLFMVLRLDRVAVKFLWSRFSRPMVKRFVKKNGIDLTDEEIKSFRSYRELFIRVRQNVPMDMEKGHLISPCDGWLSAFPIDEESRFAIKGSLYGISDFLKDEELAKNYLGGLCLVFRLCASDYHHYCYIDNGKQGENHPSPGKLHSVQPIACEKYPVFVLNKRSWCVLDTENFGPVVQCEIGALIVGGIVNHKENEAFKKGEEKGRFELSGSTIVLLLEKDRVELKPEILKELEDAEEVRVLQGAWVASAK